MRKKKIVDVKEDGKFLHFFYEVMSEFLIIISAFALVLNYTSEVSPLNTFFSILILISLAVGLRKISRQ
jgi:hypothetical protein